MYCNIICNPLILFAFWGMRFAGPEPNVRGVVHMPKAKKAKKAKKAPAKKAKKAKRKKK